jgi:hypothetical protein
LISISEHVRLRFVSIKSREMNFYAHEAMQMEHAGFLKVMLHQNSKTTREIRARRRGQHVTLLLIETMGLTFKLHLFATTEELGAETVDYNICIYLTTWITSSNWSTYTELS